jgi:hypothetical protein
LILTLILSYDFSLGRNELGPEGNKAIIDMLKINETITSIK